MLSFAENIPTILEAVQEVNPRKVLDVGAGFGKYGLLVREQYLSNKAKSGDLSPRDDMIVNAIEDNMYFLNSDRIWKIYNSVFIRPVEDVHTLAFCIHYDLTLLIDVIEHWTIQEAVDRVHMLLSYSDNILISTPKHVSMYKESFYGDNRHHITQYDNMFPQLLKVTNYTLFANPLSWIWLIKGTP